MESYYFINLIFIFAVNVFFFFSGICLNSLVILSFWRSVQLRKKLCYFMIMVLSCCDLLTVLINNPLMALFSMSWLTGNVMYMLDMASCFLKFDKYFPCFLIIRSFGDEFRSIFGDILSYISSNIGNEGKTFNSSCNTDHRRSNFESDLCKRLCYFLPSTYSNSFYSIHSCNVIYQLQTVSSRQEKS